MLSESVVVAFHDYHNHDKPAHEVWLPDDHGVPVICERQGDEAVFTTRLSDLLPVAIEHDTPVKSKCFVSEVTLHISGNGFTLFYR